MITKNIKVKKIGITGINGFMGWHLRTFLYGYKDVKVFGADRGIFLDKKMLSDFVRSCDIIIHFAGMNRGDDAEVMSTNIDLAEKLIAACDTANSTPHIIFSSSTQISLNTAYGLSKLSCAKKFKYWSRRSGALFTNLILPNVFGECGKPFYNSVVATFCHQIANQEEPEILKNNKIELIHAQAVAEKIFNVITYSSSGDIRVTGRDMTVNDLKIKLLDLANQYKNNVVPALKDDFDVSLFNTIRSYFYPHRYPVKLAISKDDRGGLFEAIKSFTCGKCFISTTNEGFVRGNHYHRIKFERFLVVSGTAEIRIRKLFSKDVVIFKVNGKDPCFVDIPTLHTHNITNIGKDKLLTLFWKDVVDDTDKDTFSEPVEV